MFPAISPAISKAVLTLLIVFIKAWQWTFSLVFPASCRYEPSCSHYAIEALNSHGLIKGSYLALKRIARCHPWGGSGVDPVPPATKRNR